MLGLYGQRELIRADIFQRAVTWNDYVLGRYFRGLYEASPNAGTDFGPVNVPIQLEGKPFLNICIGEALFMYHGIIISMNIAIFSTTGLRIYANKNLQY